MTLEQLTFRIEIEGPHASTFVHFIDSEKGYFTVKVGDAVMSVGEFSQYVKQLAEIESKLFMIGEFAKNVES